MKSRRLGIKTTWIWTYFLVIVAMEIVFLLGLKIVRNTIESNERQVNYDKAVYMKDYLDDSLKRVYEYSMQIINNNTAKALDQKSPKQGWTKIAYQLSNDMFNYSLSNSMVEDIMLYYPINDNIVGIKGVYRSHTYWRALFPNRSENDYERWMKAMFINRASGYFSVNDKYSNVLCYKIAVPHLNQRMLVAKIKVSELESALDRIRQNNNQNLLCLVDDNGIVYAYSGSVEEYIDKETDKLNINNTDSILYTELDSAISGLRYITVTKTTSALHISDVVMKISIIAALIGLTIGALVLLILIKHNAKPIEKIVIKLASGKQLDGNEIDIINEQIDELVENNKDNLNKYRKQQSMLAKRTFLNDCLRFDQPFKRDVETVAASYGLSFDNEEYAVVVRERSGDDYSDIVLDYLERTEDSYGCIIAWMQKQDLDVFLINYDPMAKVPFKDNTLGTHLEVFLDDIKTELSSANSVIVQSGHFSKLEELRKAYTECLKLLQRKEIAVESSRHVSAGNEDEFKDIAGRAKSIIDESYQNPILGLYMIAEQIGSSQSYVSRIFKKKYNVGISQYINQVRIIEAKKILDTDKDATITEIALRVGFGSADQFIRVFKKHEKITPGLYKGTILS